MNHPFTDAYIHMAKAAEEIQAMRPLHNDFQEGEWFESSARDPFRPLQIMVVGDCEPGLRVQGNCDDQDDVIPGYWLPRLDQLLGMLTPRQNPTAYWEYLYRGGFLKEGRRAMEYYDAVREWKEYLAQFSDWHELALAVVMKEKHGKIWRDEKWEKV
jgi:hypothetical protein